MGIENEGKGSGGISKDDANRKRTRGIISKLAERLGFRESDIIDHYAEKLIEYKIVPERLEKVCDKISVSYKVFPSLKTFFEELRIEKGSTDKYLSPLEIERCKRKEKEIIWHNEIKKEFTLKFKGKDYLKYTEFWLKNVYPSVLNRMGQIGINLEMWSMPALFDLCIADYDFDNAVLLGKKKSDHLGKLSRMMNEGLLSHRKIFEEKKKVEFVKRW